MNIKGVTQLVYDATIPERDGKIPFEELSDFDRLIYELTYCCFAPLKSANGKSWETAKTSQENLAYHTYGSFLAFMPDTGNNRETVNAAFQKLWDWQYAYILEHDEPYDFVDQCAYSDMFPGSEDKGSEAESLTPQESEEIEEILNELDESDKKEIQQAVEQEKKAENSDRVPMPVVTLWEYGKGHGGSRRDKAIPEMPILSAFPGFYPLLELGVFFVFS